MAQRDTKAMSTQEESANTTDHQASSPAPPQASTSLPDAVAADMASLNIGDPSAIIAVPMIHSSRKQRKRDLLLPYGKPGPVTQVVIVRKMTREHYLKHYAKDAQGNYVGTEKAAMDAALVFVMGKSSDKDLLEQVHRVAFGKEHSQRDYMNGWAITQTYNYGGI